MTPFTLEDFVRESNRIEGITREPTWQEIAVHSDILARQDVSLAGLERFVSVVAPGKQLRQSTGMNVRVGSHIAPPGGEKVMRELTDILVRANTGASPFLVHVDYERLHPFMDGNGRSGRVLWLWMMGGIEKVPLGFLHHWYYQSLSREHGA